MQLELYGNVQRSTIWQGVLSLYDSGEWFVALVIFVASLIIPYIKMFLLIYLSARLKHPSAVTAHDFHAHRAIEVLGRWSMLDIFLVAILVAMLKFGAMARVEIQAGAIFFLVTVLITMTVSELLSRAVHSAREQNLKGHAK